MPPVETVPRQRQDDDLVVMSFGDHLEELRFRIFRVLAGLALGTLVALFFQEDLMRLVSGPHWAAMARVNARQETARAARDLRQLAADLAEVPSAMGQAVVARHRRVVAAEALVGRIRASGDEAAAASAALFELVFEELGHTSYFDRFERAVREARELTLDSEAVPWGAQEGLERAARELEAVEQIVAGWRQATDGSASTAVDWSLLERRLHALEGVRNGLLSVQGWETKRPPLKVLSYPEGFFAHMKICILAGLLLAFPWASVELWRFIAAGLYERERSAVWPFIPMSLIFFLAGGAFAYHILVPIGLAYLGGYASPDVIETSFTLRDYISLVITMILGMGLVFQLPLLMIFLTRAGIASVEQFRSYRKIAIFSAVCLGAFLTPPDPMTQLLMAGPLAILYECGIWGSILLARRAKERAS